MQTTITTGLSRKLENMAIVCAILVVGQHIMRSHPYGSGSWCLFQIVDSGLARIAVPFFFAASGFFLCGSIDQAGFYKKAVLKRLRTLIIPFLLWNVLYFLWRFSLSSMSVGHFNLDLVTAKNVIDVMGLDPLDAPFLRVTWYIRSLFILVLLSPLFARYLVVFRGGVLIAYLVYVVGYAVSVWGEPISMMFIRRFFCLQGVAFFLLGMHLRKFPISVKLSKCMLGGFVLTGAALCVVKVLCTGHRILFQGLTTIIIPLLLIPVWCLMPRKEWPKWIVSSAFGIYLIHPFLIYPLQRIATGFLQTWYGFLLGYALVVAASICLISGLKKIWPNAANLLLGGR